MRLLHAWEEQFLSQKEGCTLQKRDGYFNLAKVISVAE